VTGEVATISEATLPESTNKRKRITSGKADAPTQPGTDPIESNKRRRITSSKAKGPTQKISGVISHDNIEPVQTSNTDASASNQARPVTIGPFTSAQARPITLSPFTSLEASGAVGENSGVGSDVSDRGNNRPSNTSGRNSPQALGAGVSSEVAGTNSSVGTNSNVGVSSGLVGTNSSIGLGVSSGLVGTPSSIALGVGANTQISGNSPLISRLGVSSGVSSNVHANIYHRPLLPKGVIDPRLLGDYVASGNNPQVGNTTSIPSISNIPQVGNNTSIPSISNIPRVGNTTSIPPIGNIGSNPIYLAPIQDPASSVVVRPYNFFEYRSVTSLFTNPQDVLVGTTNSYLRDSRDIVAIDAGHKRQNFNDAINLAYDRLDIHCRHIPDNQKLSKLQPLIAEHIGKLNLTYVLTVSDVAELKYILSLSNHDTGLNVKTRGLYNKLSMQHGNTVHVDLNTGSRTKKLLILNDLRAIQAGLVSNNNP